MTNTNGVANITANVFDQTINNGITLVDFWAPWCYPCRMQGPILEKVAQRIGNRVKIGKLNVSENAESQKIAGKLGITGIPTLMVFKEGEKIRQFIGLQDEETLVSSLESILSA